VVDAEKARRLLGVLLDAISDLRRYHKSVTREELVSRRDTQHMVLHALYVAVQASVELAMHLASDSGLAQPVTYQGAFHRLAEAAMLESGLASRLAAWAGFRNVLAHMYAAVDYDRVYDALGEVDDLERFAIVVARLLEAG
jgi:uncharacterized protein YutE (UPF0331/DUF86 family)